MGFKYLVRDQEVEGSNLFAPTNSFKFNSLQATKAGRSRPIQNPAVRRGFCKAGRRFALEVIQR